MATLVVSPSAQQDLTDIFDYIARDKPVAAAMWIEKVEQKCRRIAATPDVGEARPEYGSDIRSSIIGRYVIFHRTIVGGIEVVRVIAGDRDIRSI
ncbi:Plasmid stabilization system protein [Rosistilla ulvae]|uniref:Plasmid stabilization system protein n=1 Tax=Rosistilla ulvae TaxID=1930277 RepID=A0A517M7E0_9BACT|nr:type II toxin-antitoxin system RelE/ParE family toxin [Rosistilla ulvae]QDS90799.1 Plasmid stabilization system protein [Rosistilla ulvae]